MRKIIGKIRREFIAKMIVDMGKTIFAIGLASYFFKEFPSLLKITLTVVCIIFLIGSIFIQPFDKGGE